MESTGAHYDDDNTYPGSEGRLDAEDQEVVGDEFSPPVSPDAPSRRLRTLPQLFDRANLDIKPEGEGGNNIQCLVKDVMARPSRLFCVVVLENNDAPQSTTKTPARWAVFGACDTSKSEEEALVESDVDYVVLTPATGRPFIIYLVAHSAGVACDSRPVWLNSRHNKAKPYVGLRNPGIKATAMGTLHGCVPDEKPKDIFKQPSNFWCDVYTIVDLVRLRHYLSSTSSAKQQPTNLTTVCAALDIEVLTICMSYCREFYDKTYPLCIPGTCLGFAFSALCDLHCALHHVRGVYMDSPGIAPFKGLPPKPRVTPGVVTQNQKGRSALHYQNICAWLTELRAIVAWLSTEAATGRQYFGAYARSDELRAIEELVRMLDACFLPRDFEHDSEVVTGSFEWLLDLHALLKMRHSRCRSSAASTSLAASASPTVDTTVAPVVIKKSAAVAASPASATTTTTTTTTTSPTFSIAALPLEARVELREHLSAICESKRTMGPPSQPCGRSSSAKKAAAVAVVINDEAAHAEPVRYRHIVGRDGRHFKVKRAASSAAAKKSSHSSDETRQDARPMHARTEVAPLPAPLDWGVSMNYDEEDDALSSFAMYNHNTTAAADHGAPLHGEASASGHFDHAAPASRPAPLPSPFSTLLSSPGAFEAFDFDEDSHNIDGHHAHLRDSGFGYSSSDDASPPMTPIGSFVSAYASSSGADDVRTGGARGDHRERSSSSVLSLDTPIHYQEAFRSHEKDVTQEHSLIVSTDSFHDTPVSIPAQQQQQQDHHRHHHHDRTSSSAMDVDVHANVVSVAPDVVPVPSHGREPHNVAAASAGGCASSSTLAHPRRSSSRWVVLTPEQC